MKIVEIINLRNKLSTASGLKGFELNYVINKSIREITESLVEVVAEEKRILAIIEDYNSEAKALYEKASTDENGVINQAPVNGGMSYKPIESNKAELAKDLITLNEKHKSVLELNKEENLKFAVFLSETESDFVLKTVDVSMVKSDNTDITTENFNAISDILI